MLVAEEAAVGLAALRVRVVQVAPVVVVMRVPAVHPRLVAP